MRGLQLRLLSSGVLAALVAWAVSLSGHAVRGQPLPAPPGQPGKKDDKAKDKDDRSELDLNLPFAPPYDRDHKKRLNGARDYLNVTDPSNIKWNEVCGFLQTLLNSKSDSFFDVEYQAGGVRRINRISVKTEANRIISTFSPEGLQFYQQAEGASAAQLLDDARKANYDIAMLADLSQRYFYTKAGAEGTILLATIYLERGNFVEAAYAFERLLPRKDVDDLFTARTLFKACLALKRSGDARHLEVYKATLERFEKAARNGVAIGRRTYTPEQLKAELDRPVELVATSSVVDTWPMRGGSPARGAVVNGGPPFLDPVFRAPMLPADLVDDDGKPTTSTEANIWIRGALEPLFARDSKAAARGVPLPGGFPVTTSDMLVYRGYDGVYGVAVRDRVVGGRVVRAGDVVWKSKTAAGLHQLVETGSTDDIEMKRNVERWWTTYSGLSAKASSILYENPLLGGLSHDGQNAFFVDDVAIPPPPVYSNPDFGINGGPQFPASGDLSEMVRGGRLIAVDMRTGKEVWSLGRLTKYERNAQTPLPLNEEEADKTTDAFRLCLDAVFLCAPMPLNGRLYVLVEQAGCVRLLCLDPKTLVQPPGQTRKPVLLWSQKLGKPNTPLPIDSIRRYQGATLAAGEGIIICPTNSGVLVAVDVMSRSLLWAYGYRPVEQVNNPRRPQFGNDGLPIMPEQLPVNRWRAGGPIISNGRAIVTAHDSRHLDCIDLRTGKVLWRVNRDDGDLYVGGVVNDRVVVVGKSRVRAYHLTGEDKETQRPKLAWESEPIPTPTGHGAVGRNAFYLPVRQETAGQGAVPAAEVWAINLDDGKVTAKTAARKRGDATELVRYGIGNLVFQDGLVFAQSAHEVLCFPQLEQKIAEMDQRLKANPKDPLGLLARGELRLDDGKLADAVADFKAAEANDLPAEKRPLLREKLYVAYTELLRHDFASAEKYLAEYEALCELPADPAESPEDQARREEETKRRKRVHYNLMARGREGQGRLGEAFEFYLKLAASGEGRLEEMPDEPNVKTRPDVWARGRIEAMLRRAATADARKSLEERVAAEWDKVKDGHDLKKLRQFVTVFGPFFESGRAAQFKLVDVLLATNNEAEAREAQAHLAQLRVAADDPQVRARATEHLARLMIQNRMMEDAVGLYLQLGKEYPDVVVRDGKTGADFLTDLLTDKRLLPYLEPSRYPMPTRMKAEGRQENVSMNGVQFELESPPDLFPMYRRLRFALDTSGGGGWVLKATDRATGGERLRFPPMQAPNLYSNGPIPYSKFIQGTGGTVLLQMGMWVYCYDLIEKRLLWERNLLGNDQPQAPPGYNPNPQVEVGPDGECIVRYQDGYTMWLGRSAVLQPGYVCLLTRDGLECVEPVSRRILWTRRVADRTQILGDARYVVLIESDANRKVVSTKLIRALDGMVVEDSPDSGRVLADAKSYRLFGRHALLTGGGGDRPAVLRLYDMATGKDVWKKEFDAKAVPLASPLNGEWAGFVRPDGTAEVVAVKTGEAVATLKIGPKEAAEQMKGCVGATILADADRYYLLLDRDPSAAAASGARAAPVYNSYMLRSHRANGPIHAFARGSGKRLWSYTDALEHQWLVLEQFAEMPVLLASAPVFPNGQNNGQPSQVVVVIEKERGRLLMDRPVPYNGNLFMNLTVDARTGTISMNRYDYRVLITPDEVKK
jgi:outer membrane protein assembly factor BamB